MSEQHSEFPMTVKEFFENPEKYLKRGDILLSRSPTPASRIIRLFSGTFFSHAAMVFLLPQKKEGFSSAFVIESLFKGVGVANLETYLRGRKPIEEVGVLRMQGEGFTIKFFKSANGYLLNEVNKPYDFSRLWRIAFSTWFGMQQAIKRVSKRPSIYRRWMPRQFICSGFIQYGIYQAAKAFNLDSDRVVLKNGLHNPTPDQMMGTTPEDLATSKKLTWKYAIRRGWVYEVETYDDAKRIISGA